jgi:coproporphyrinogen III oxidase
MRAATTILGEGLALMTIDEHPETAGVTFLTPRLTSARHPRQPDLPQVAENARYFVSGMPQGL